MKIKGKAKATAEDEKLTAYQLQCMAKYDAWIKRLNLPNNEENLLEWDQSQNQKQLLKGFGMDGMDEDSIRHAVVLNEARELLKEQG